MNIPESNHIRADLGSPLHGRKSRENLPPKPCRDSAFKSCVVKTSAYGSTDLTSPIAGYQKQSQFAAGGLLGYDFGPIKLQAYATTDVFEHNYGGTDTRGWLRMIVPLWKPAPQQTSLITKG
jgi:hypothetical protein